MSAILTGNRARIFMLAGNARVTLENPGTGNRFTYRVRAPKVQRDGKPVWFVSVLTGSNNEDDYTFLGTIFSDGTFRRSAKSRIGEDAPSAKAFAWAWGRVFSVSNWAPAQIRHEGRCGRCGRALTVPSSIDTGLGPDCAEKMS